MKLFTHIAYFSSLLLCFVSERSSLEQHSSSVFYCIANIDATGKS